MHVELENHIGINLVTKKPEAFKQYFVFIVDDDDQRDKIGLIGWHKGAKLLFTSRTDPVTRAWVEEQVGIILKATIDSVERPELPPEQDEEEESFDELDEEDFTI